MRIFLAGASGVIGHRLVPRLVEDGHHVSAMTRRSDRVDALEAQGVEPVVCDVFDAERLRQVVVAARPEVVIQHLTDLPLDLNPRNLKRAYVANDRVRSEGSANLVSAAGAAGARRFVAQNVCFAYAPVGGPIKDEDAPIARPRKAPWDRTGRVYVEMERRITASTILEGLVLRCGFWYGPETSFAADGFTAREVRRRRLPIIGDGAGIFSFVHVDDVAEATIAALTQGDPGVYNVCDDDPAPMREWLPEFAAAIGAPAPRRVPALLARLVVGEFAVQQATTMRGASNEKVRRELDWKPRYSSWREGFRTALG
jgi:nucleoside-diphosphate-sugar epimerase